MFWVTGADERPKDPKFSQDEMVPLVRNHGCNIVYLLDKADFLIGD